MNRKSWMLVLSMALSIPSFIGLACESREHRASEKAALQAIGRMNGSGSSESNPNASGFDAILNGAESPEMRRFASEAKAHAEQDDDLNAITGASR